MRAWPGIEFTTLIAMSIAAAALPGLAQAEQKFPNKPIRIVVPFSAGGTPDTLARMLGQKMSETWGQPVVVENRPGAGGSIGANIVARAAPDGHTLLLTSPAFAIGAALHPNLPYDPARDFAGVANIGFGTNVLVVSPALGVRTVKELIALARAHPGKILYGSAGSGSSTHMNAERFGLAARIKTVHVAFKGQPEFLIEIAAGRIHYGVGGLGPALPLIRDSKLLALAVAQRSPLLPGVPAMAEVLHGWGRDGSQLLLAPAGTPRPVLNQISKEVARILDLPDIRDRLQAVSFHVAPSTPEETDNILRADIEIFSKVAKEAGLRTQ